MRAKEMVWLMMLSFLLVVSQGMSEPAVVHVEAKGGTYRIANWTQASSVCAKVGMRLATVEQLEESWKKGLSVCSCGWLADGSVGYPIRTPREGCGTQAAGIRKCTGDPDGEGWDAYCIKSELAVVHVQDRNGPHQIKDSDAADRKCRNLGMRLATLEQLKEAWTQGLDVCWCGWLADGTAGYPIWKPRNGCGNTPAGIRMCSRSPSVGWDAFCTKSEVPIVHVQKMGAGGYPQYQKIPTWEAATSECAQRGMRLATRELLTQAWKQGFDRCNCGWLADGTVGWPIYRGPTHRKGCSVNKPAVWPCIPPGPTSVNKGYDAFCTKLPLPVAHIEDGSGRYRIADWAAAVRVCSSRGMRLATREQLREAWRQGMDKCACGWLADGSAGYPILKPRSGCDVEQPAGIRACWRNSTFVGWDAYCTNAIKLSVVRAMAAEGSYKLDDAAAANNICANRGMRLATRDQLEEARKQGLDDCKCGWLVDGSAGYPIVFTRGGCGTGPPGIRHCPRAPTGEGYDAYCTDEPLPVLHVVHDSGPKQILSAQAAAEVCESRGLRLATRDQLEEARQKGLHTCSCGWLADGSSAYPVLRTGGDCGTVPPGVRGCVTVPGVGKDAYCTNAELSVVHITGIGGNYQIPDWENARRLCARRGMRLATYAQLEDARTKGLDVCSCGWLADGTAAYPNLRPRTGCGDHPAGIRICGELTNGVGWDAYCTKSKLSVVHVVHEMGTYQIKTWSDAVDQCNSRGGMRLATREQLTDAWKEGMDVCACGWLADGSGAYPVVKAREGCGDPMAGVKTCHGGPDAGQGWDAFCTDIELPVVRLVHEAQQYSIPDAAAAAKMCAGQGMRLATKAQMKKALRMGLDKCACGWLADGDAAYVAVRPRRGCLGHTELPGMKYCSRTGKADAYCSKEKLDVVHIQAKEGGYKIPSWEAAVKECAMRGLRLATRKQLEEARKKGLDVCQCGWLADGTVGYPIVRPRTGCGTDMWQGGIRACPSSAPRGAGWDAYCTDIESPVLHVADKDGRYKIPTVEAAAERCASLGMRLAAKVLLSKAREMGYDSCACGWLADGTVSYPIVKPREGCERSIPAGVRFCPKRPNATGWDAYCTKSELSTVLVSADEGHNKVPTVEAAIKLCESRGMRIATYQQLTDERLHSCQCGWLADGTARYPFARDGDCNRNSEYPSTWISGQCPGSMMPAGGHDVYCTKIKVPVVHVTDPRGHYRFPTPSAAAAACARRGMRLASYTQLQDAWKQGYHVCNCGWLADAKAAYPIQRPGTGCGMEKAGIRTCSKNPSRGWDAYCTGVEIPVVHAENATGAYKIPSSSVARDICGGKGLRLARIGELRQAWRLGMHKCRCGWIDNGLVAFPKIKKEPGCTQDPIGVRTCDSNPWGKGFDTYCWRGYKNPNDRVEIITGD